MKEIIAIFLGGGIGSVLRYLVNLQITRLAGWAFPLGILTINVTGSLLMGMVAGYFIGKTDVWSQDVRLFLATGILGGYTTFSAFSLDAANLIQRGEPGTAAFYVGASVLFSIIGLFCGLWVIKVLA